MHSDLIIIGGGPGGYETALAAASRGLSVTLFEAKKLGGTCLNEGCIPTKALCRNAEIIDLYKHGEEFGIDEFQFTVDFDKIQARKNNIVTNLREGIAGLLSRAKVSVINEYASFRDEHTVIAGGTEYTADNFIIATGSESRSLPIQGAELDCVMNSTQLLEIDHVPESLTIIGGGVIGMEFAAIFNSLGSKVTVIEFMKQILPPFDSDISKRLKQSLQKKGITIITSAAAKKIEQNSDGEIVVTYELKDKEEQISSTELLMAVGRSPRINSLNLDSAGISYTPKGIDVDDMMRTNKSNIFAIGDVNGKMMLAHVATYQGIRALNCICGTEDSIKFDVVPSAVFTVPECGMAGMTEDQCKSAGINIKIGQSFFRANGKALALGEPDGICKLIFNAETERLIGIHIMGVQAADLAQQGADLINKEATLRQIKDIIFGHPTVSEVILNACHNVK